jgi:RimJ/RimL family protein N-acetyltransferase
MPCLEGERVILREFRQEDIPLIHAWVNDREVVRYLSWAVFPQTARETESFVEAQMRQADPLNRAFVIALREPEGLCIGTIGCHKIDWRNRNAELGIVVGRKEYQSKGYGTEATWLLLGFCFDELNLHRVYLQVFDFNQRAVRSYLKCGFVEEGRLRQAFFRDGHYHDIVVMGLLAAEFQALRSSRESLART